VNSGAVGSGSVVGSASAGALGGAVLGTGGAGKGSGEWMRSSVDSQSGGRDCEALRLFVVQPVASANRHAKALAVLNTLPLCECGMPTQDDSNIKRQNPNTKHENPNIKEVSNCISQRQSQVAAPVVVGVWNVSFFGVWCLVFGV